MAEYAEYIDKNKTTHEMWQNLYELEEKLEKEHGLDICERHDVQIGFEAGLKAVVNMPTIDIVHCKDCIYFQKGWTKCKMLNLNGADGDWYCADGERNEVE